MRGECPCVGVVAAESSVFKTAGSSVFKAIELPTRPAALQLVILDLKLPKVSGLDVLRRIRAQAHTRLLPVVVLSTSREDADVRSSYALGANAYVRKPVAFEDFLATMSRLGLFWMETNVPAPPGDWPVLPRH